MQTIKMYKSQKRCVTIIVYSNSTKDKVLVCSKIKVFQHVVELLLNYKSLLIKTLPHP